MKARPTSISRKNRGAPAQPPSFSAAGSPDAAREVATKVLHRQGYILLSVLSVIQDNLIELNCQVDVEYLNDAVKPLADALIHFEFERHGDSHG